MAGGGEALSQPHDGDAVPGPAMRAFVWLSTALVMGALLGLAEGRRNPLNDPDQAWQRTGVLLPARSEPAPVIGSSHSLGRRRVIVFARSLKGRHLFPDLADQSDLTGDADLVVVTLDGSRPMIEWGIDDFLTDRDGSLANAFRFRSPIDGEYPVGYTLIDGEGFIRYRTLDPGFDRRAWEIKLLLSEMR